MKDSLAKPNQLIEIEGTLNLSQLKTYNVILNDIHRSIQNDKKKGNITDETIKEKYTLNYKDIKLRSGILVKDDKKLRKNIEDIAKVNITITDKKGKDWIITSLLSEVKYISSKEQLEIYLSPSIRKALYYSNYYTTLDLLLMKRFKSKYSVVLYELLKKYEGINIPKYSIEDFSKIFQTKYKRFNDIKKNILDVAIREVERETGYKINYEIDKIGRRIAYINLKWEKKGGILNSEILEGVILENKTSGINKAILKAKQNIFVSKSWNKSVDNKIEKMCLDRGEEFTINLLNELYNNLKEEIKTTLVQYLNGMIKNINQEEEEKELKEDKSKQVQGVDRLKEKLEVLRIDIRESKNDEKQIQEITREEYEGLYIQYLNENDVINNSYTRRSFDKMNSSKYLIIG